MMWFIAWYLVGFVTFSILTYFVDKRITVKHLVYVPLFSALGPLLTLAAFGVWVKEEGDTVLISWGKEKDDGV